MGIKQQKETLSYFNKHAKEWENKAKITSKDKVNVINQRNKYVLDIIVDRDKTEAVLDVGCGTGDLVHKIAKRGIRAVGIDFSEEMIQIARDVAKKGNYKLAEFECCSIFDFDFSRAEYDVISANGFIEYISFAQLIWFLEISYSALRKNGSLVLGSRNRLFNIFSLNNFTRHEVNKNTANLLLLESIALVKGLKISELLALESAPLPDETQKQANTGINVSTRYQYTPVQLMKLLKDKGFDPIHVSPIHIHGVTPDFKDEYPAIHGNISNLLQDYAKDNTQLLPSASSFMIHARKR